MIAAFGVAITEIVVLIDDIDDIAATPDIATRTSP